MVYIKEILWLISWPLIIWVNYLIIRFVMKKYDARYSKVQSDKPEEAGS